jgi:hypothetical protein
MIYAILVCTRMAGFPQGDACYPMMALRPINSEADCKMAADDLRHKMPQLAVRWHDQNGDWTRSVDCYEMPSWTQAPGN